MPPHASAIATEPRAHFDDQENDEVNRRQKDHADLHYRRIDSAM
jgi:hypothetical protein